MAEDLDDLDGAEGGPQPAESRELVIVELGRCGVDAAQLLSQLEGSFGFAPVGQEPAGLPAHSLLGMQGPTGRRRRGLDQHSAVG
jgi:hypothetical protein